MRANGFAPLVVGLGLLCVTLSWRVPAPKPASPEGSAPYAIERGAYRLEPPMPDMPEPMPYCPDPQLDSDLQARAEAAEQKVAAYEATFSNLHAMRFQVRQLEAKAALEPDGQIGRWAAQMSAMPDERTLLEMASLLLDYPVELTPDEGLWLVDRIQARDWHLWGPSVDEAIIQFFSPSRIAEGCTPMQSAYLQEQWADYF